MKILLDECVDQRFRRDLVHYGSRGGWAGKKNGELLALAAKSYDVFLTVDRSTITIAVLVMTARTNRLADLRPLAKDVLSELSVLKPGEVSIVPKKSN